MYSITDSIYISNQICEVLKAFSSQVAYQILIFDRILKCAGIFKN